MKQIAAVVGSWRRESINLRFARALATAESRLIAEDFSVPDVTTQEFLAALIAEFDAHVRHAGR
jgi:hypothetical protein